MLISILITTKDRPEKLKQTLEAIASLDVPPEADYEVLVMDNGSANDAAAKICREMGPTLRRASHFATVAGGGKSRAANAGFEMSHGEIIAFLDDDILPRQDWLSVIYREFSSDPDLGGISGRVELRDPKDLPFGIRQKTERARLNLPMDASTLFIGCNFAVRRAVIEKHGLYDPLLGPGARIGGGEDLDFCYRVWKAGERLVYEPSLFVYHAHGRQSEKHSAEIRRLYTVGRGAFFAKHVLQGDSRIAREMYWNVRTEIRDVVRPGRTESLRHLAWLASGFFRYSLARITGARKAKEELTGRG
jgi:cellulose synthase/poly-beta-1,6-N-acetylglucosamine synthase-like glycosyltransferase